MGAAQYVDVPGYKAIIFRRTFMDLALPGALIDRSKQWWSGTAAQWNTTDRKWTFPSGAVIQFGYLEREADKYRYQSSEYHYVFFDELTQFGEDQYLYLFSRVRRLKEFDVPLRIRGAGNPGGVGHIWVKRRFMGTEEMPVDSKKRLFIPSRLEDNPYLDQEQYEEALSNLDPVTRAQLRYGDWDIDARGGTFQRSWFLIEEKMPDKFKYVCRYWDTAATHESEHKDPDFTVGTKYGVDENGEYWVLDVVRFRETPAKTEHNMARVAAMDGLGVDIWVEQEAGASGKSIIDHYRRNVLPGYTMRGIRPTGQKEIRAKPVSAEAENGKVHVMYAKWNEAWFDELSIFPEGTHDDQVDSLSGAHYVVSRVIRGRYRKQAKQRYGYR